MSEQSPIAIFKGDDSFAFGARTINIRLTTDLDLTGATAQFDLLSYRKTFTSAVTQTKTFQISFTAAETKRFPLGNVCGTLKLFDSSNRVLTACCAIPFSVRLPGAPGTCEWKRYGTPVSIDVYIGMDYAYVFNKPTIDGVVIDGDRDAHYYGLAKLTDISSSSSVVTGYYWNGKFYHDAGHTQEITGENNKIYIDLTTNTQYRWNADTTAYVKISASIEVDDHLDPESTNPVQNKVIKGALDSLNAAVGTKANLVNLKGAFADPADVLLATASIKEYLVNLYNAIQALTS